MTARIAAAVLVIATLVACEAFPIGPTPPAGEVRGGWLWPTPAPLPAGALPVPIDVGRPFDVPADAELACPLALLGSLTVEYRAGEDPPVRYRSGEEVRVVWPAGFSARLNPRLEIVAPDGAVFAREGLPTAEFGGGFGGDGDDRFHICMFEYMPRRLDAPG